MAEPRDPIQEMLITARRIQILDAATTVFAEKGFHRATIKDIARVAGVADGTIYTYFTNKNAVLLAILDRLNETNEREQQLAQSSLQDRRAFFLAYARQRMSLFWPNAEVFRAVLPEMLVNSELRELYYQQVLAPTFAVAERFFQSPTEKKYWRNLDTSLTIRAIAASFLGMLMLQLLGDQEVAQRWQELPEILTTMILDGLYLENTDSEEKQ